jgi:hypothetical protein
VTLKVAGSSPDQYRENCRSPRADLNSEIL